MRLIASPRNKNPSTASVNPERIMSGVCQLPGRPSEVRTKMTNIPSAMTAISLDIELSILRGLNDHHKFALLLVWVGLELHQHFAWSAYNSLFVELSEFAVEPQTPLRHQFLQRL